MSPRAIGLRILRLRVREELLELGVPVHRHGKETAVDLAEAERLVGVEALERELVGAARMTPEGPRERLLRVLRRREFRREDHVRSDREARRLERRIRRRDLLRARGVAVRLPRDRLERVALGDLVAVLAVVVETIGAK